MARPQPSIPSRAVVAVVAATAALLAGCANPTVRADRVAAETGYQKLRLDGAGMTHVGYFKSGDGAMALHVYIEHDGTPWSTSTAPAHDPTPENPLMLRLMALDPAPVLYLGRPCYFGTAASPPCEPIWWTHWRFSTRVVRSMQSALASFLAQHPEFASVQLFGFSGGGVLATLLAPHFTNCRRLVTIAAPLDVQGWTDLHEYSRLDGSQSPLDLPALPDEINQLHLAGSNDNNVPPFLIERFVDLQPRAELRSIPGFTHYCCWEEIWPSIVGHD